MSPRARLVGWKRVLFGVSVCVACVASVTLTAEPVRVKHVEGLVHGFLALRTQAGQTIAHGDLIQLVKGDRVTSRLVFRFKDGSVQDETAVFRQRGSFRLIADRLVQKGPSFPHPLDMSIDAANGMVTVHYADDGKAKTAAKHIDLPDDLANGLMPVLLKNVSSSKPPDHFSMIVATPEPRLIKLAMASSHSERFSMGGESRVATDFDLKPDIGGLKGLLAPLVGKQPPDVHVWILQGEAPAFLSSEQQFYPQGPVWRVELAAPEWPRGEN